MKKRFYNFLAISDAKTQSRFIDIFSNDEQVQMEVIEYSLNKC